MQPLKLNSIFINDSIGKQKMTLHVPTMFSGVMLFFPSRGEKIYLKKYQKGEGRLQRMFVPPHIIFSCRLKDTYFNISQIKLSVKNWQRN